MKRKTLRLFIVMLVLFFTGCPNQISSDLASVLSASTIVFTDGSVVSKFLGSGVYTNEVSGTGTGLITYTSGTTNTATVNSSTGEVTLVAVGTTIITANKAATASHSAVSNTYILKVETALNVFYYSNDASSGIEPIDNNDYTAGSSIIVLGNDGGLIKTDATFACWNTKVDGTGNNYDKEQLY